jgi:hypothetical protein
MPWCDTCPRYLAPPSVRPDGTCPVCGRAVTPAPDRPPARKPDALPPVPWHLKMFGGALALYLGFRAWQGVEWLRHAL